MVWPEIIENYILHRLLHVMLVVSVNYLHGGIFRTKCNEIFCFCHMCTTKAQISLRIHAVWSTPFLFAAWMVTRFYSQSYTHTLYLHPVSLRKTSYRYMYICLSLSFTLQERCYTDSVSLDVDCLGLYFILPVPKFPIWHTISSSCLDCLPNYSLYSGIWYFNDFSRNGCQWLSVLYLR